MGNQTFELRFEGCGHTRTIPLLHNQNDAQCFVCHPELRDVPTRGKCPECMSAGSDAARDYG
jgi:hypothetical protein